MSDDRGSYRRELGDEDERDDADVAREETGGWAEDEPETAHFRSHWPEDDDEPGHGHPAPAGQQLGRHGTAARVLGILQHRVPRRGSHPRASASRLD